MSKLIDKGRRTLEVVRENAFDIAFAVGAVAAAAVAFHGYTQGGLDELKGGAAVWVHEGTGEWPSWTPEGVEPIGDMNGVQINDLVTDGGRITDVPHIGDYDHSSGVTVVTGE